MNWLQELELYRGNIDYESTRALSFSAVIVGKSSSKHSQISTSKSIQIRVVLGTGDRIRLRPFVPIRGISSSSHLRIFSHLPLVLNSKISAARRYSFVVQCEGKARSVCTGLQCVKSI